MSRLLAIWEPVEDKSFIRHWPACRSQSNLVVSTEVSMKSEQVAVVLYVVAMAAVIVGVDFVFFRNRFWERLTVNIGIVLVFGAFYLRFLRRP